MDNLQQTGLSESAAINSARSRKVKADSSKDRPSIKSVPNLKIHVDAPSSQVSPEVLLANYEAIVRRTVDAFGDEERASLWLSTPSADLDGQVPLKIANEDDYSITRLEAILIRIEHGIDFDV